MSRGKILGILASVGLLGAIAWWQSGPLLARYYTSQLSHAEEANRENWVARLLALDENAVPALLNGLQSADKKTYENIECVLVGLSRQWGPADPRSLTLLETVHARFDAFDTNAKNSVLQIPIVLLKKTRGNQNVPLGVTRLARDLLTASVNDEALRISALYLAGALVDHVPSEEWLSMARSLALAGLNSVDPDTRIVAMQLIMRPALRQETEIYAKLVPLLKDHSSKIRKTALLALGQMPTLVSEDDLLPLLHDPDDEVQNLCELALRGRGLPENHILLARLISDEKPSARLKVLGLLREATDLEPGVWLQRLCQDTEPAVRAAAIRAAVSQTQVDMSSCLRDMAQQDPSDTVRQLASYYLRRAHLVRAD